MKPPLEIVTSNSSKINASVIWLHGLGADGYDFEPIVHELNLPNVRFILPHAPDMAITRNNGYIMPAWYDVYGLTPISKEDDAGIRNSENYINTLIQLEIDKGIAAEKIVIAGFSQGGALALHTALRYPKKLAGVLALSTYLPLKSTLAAEANTANAKLPIFMAHGIFDDVITIESAKVSLATLQSSQYLVNWHEYSMAHSLCAQEIADIRDFLQQVLQQDLVE
ncbi:MAG TPA: alpha/beta fold hydrolase [Methylotenera sp.]|nr:alpha/beta fold hydrolase [Methylotenera sp.]